MSSSNEQEENENKDEEEEYEEETEEKEDYENVSNSVVNNYFNFLSFNQLPNSNDNFSVFGGATNGQQNTSLDNNYNMIYFLTEQFMNDSGWNLFNKEGNLIKNFTSLELFKYLTENILANNIQLNDFFILNNKIDIRFLGGELYLLLIDIIPLVLKSRQQQYLNEFNIFFSLQMINNGGTNLLNNNGYNFNINNSNNNLNNNMLNNISNNISNNNINNINNSNINNYNMNNFNYDNNNMINLNNRNDNIINNNNKE